MTEELKTAKRPYVKRFVAGYLMIIFILVGNATLYAINSAEQRYAIRETQGYIRYLTCVANIRNQEKTITISDEISASCWKEAERQTGVTLQRFSKEYFE